MFDFLTKNLRQPKITGGSDEDQESHDSRLLKALYSWVILLLGACVLLSVQVVPFFEEHKRGAHFIEELAFAMILAGLFSLTVEKYHREEFRKFVIAERDKLKRNVFLYAYGHNVSEQTRQEIRDLLECPFHREQLKLTWQFSHIPNVPDRVRLIRRVTYIQRNGTMQPKPYSYKFHYNSAATALERVSGEPIQTVKIRRKGKADINLNGLSGELETDGIETLQPGEELEVSVTLTETRITTGEDSYSSRHPIIGTTFVTISTDNQLKLKIEAYCKGKKLRTRADHVPPDYNSWQLDEGTLPFQGILVSWSPLPQSAAATANAPATAPHLATTSPAVAPAPDAAPGQIGPGTTQN
jgi:hypothetical protein